LNAYTNLTNVEKLKDLVEKLTEDLKDFEKDLGMQKFLVKRGCQRVDDFEKEHVRVSSKLKDVTIQGARIPNLLQCVVGKVSCKTINLMSNGANVMAIPLPLKNPKSMFVEKPSAIIVKACPICLSFYACNNILVLSCGCTYH